MQKRPARRESPEKFQKRKNRIKSEKIGEVSVNPYEKLVVSFVERPEAGAFYLDIRKSYDGCMTRKGITIDFDNLQAVLPFIKKGVEHYRRKRGAK